MATKWKFRESDRPAPEKTRLDPDLINAVNRTAETGKAVEFVFTSETAQRRGKQRLEYYQLRKVFAGRLHIHQRKKALKTFVWIDPRKG